MSGHTNGSTPPGQAAVRARELERLRAEAAAAGVDVEGGGGATPRVPQAQRLIDLVMAADIELWHTPGGDPYATVLVDGHAETYGATSTGFRRLLDRLYFAREGRPASDQALADATRTLAAVALHEGQVRPVWTRVGRYDDRIYLDLGDADWRAVEVDAEGWRVVDRPPVRFRRSAAMEALPVPVGGRDLDDLRVLVNVPDRSWPLVAGWLVSTLCPNGPYAVLVLRGEQGTGKSTLAQLLRRLVDPNKSDLRADPRSERDLAIAAGNALVVAIDNLSGVAPWLSDALCRLVDGSGFSTRALYTDADEAIFADARPVLLTGITEVVTRPDLLDRCLLVELEPIPADDRTTKAQLMEAYDGQRPGLLGALLDGVSAALRRMRGVHLERPPRLADVARWATAAEPGLGLAPGAFVAAVEVNQAAAHELSVEASPVGDALRQLMDRRAGAWQGTATELLAALDRERGADRPPRGWPTSARGLVSALQRLQPPMRALGYTIELGSRTSQRRVIHLVASGPRPSRPSPPSRTTLGPEDPRDGRPPDGDGRGRLAAATVTKLEQGTAPPEGTGDGGDGRDGRGGIWDAAAGHLESVRLPWEDEEEAGGSGDEDATGRDEVGRAEGAGDHGPWRATGDDQ